MLELREFIISLAILGCALFCLCLALAPVINEQGKDYDDLDK